MGEALELLTDDELSRDLPPAVKPVPEPPSTLDQSLLLDRFTTLDRVLIDQVIATISDVEGSLDLAAVEDLIETVVSLNSGRKRSFFHLGFLDGLLPNRPKQFQRPEFNDKRRGWYLSGLLAAKTRHRDADAVRELLATHAEDFR